MAITCPEPAIIVDDLMFTLRNIFATQTIILKRLQSSQVILTCPATSYVQDRYALSSRIWYELLH